MLLEGKVALITGSNGGIGFGIAERFAREGARVVLNGRNEAKLAAAAQTIKAAGGDVLAIAADVAVEAEVERVFGQVMDRYGTLDILVNNARQRCDQGEWGPFLRMRSEGWDRFMAANLGMLFYCTHRAAQVMARKRGGSIINISSIGALRAHREMIAYDAMKGAMDAFTRAVAVDLAPWDVRVNSLQGGLIASTSYNQLPPEEQARRSASIPMRKAGQPADVAWAAVFLASDDAAWITGQSFQVDGGVCAAARSPQGELGPVVGPESLQL
ncbi:MAG: SDR family NAD(P)-dependent oxidoreductase [Chloroflexota bacterium]